MKETVVITAWQRPDFLHACLQLVSKARGSQERSYLIMLDRGHSKETYDVANAWTHQMPAASLVMQPRHPYQGNSMNVLDGYRRAIQSGAERVHLIEEDIFISEGYFDFHTQAWALDPDAFFVTACYNQNDPKRVRGGDNSIVTRFQAYQSLGVSLSRTSLEKVLIHAVPEYFGNMRGYLLEKLPGYDWCTEQDGLIQRVILKENKYGIYPQVPRAFHAGFHGYNRTGKALSPKITLEQRAEMLLTMTEEEMNNKASNAQYKDIERCQLEYFETGMLRIL